MKKIISFSIVTLAILAPGIALSQPSSDQPSPTEKKLIDSFVCSNEEYTHEDVVSVINSARPEIPIDKRDQLADLIMSAQQIPQENKNMICES